MPEPLYLVGTSGYPNFGDEFITAGWLRFLGRRRPDAEVWLDCPNPGLAAHLFDGLHPQLRTTDTLWRLIWETADLDADAADAHVDRVVTALGSPRYDLGLLGARRATSIHVLGGGYVSAIWPHHTRLLRAALRLRDVSGARVAATGLGLYPAADETALKELLGAFDHATVRDAASAELSGLEPAGDDAFLGLPYVAGFLGGSSGGSEPDEVWVCLQSDLTKPDVFEAEVEAVRAMLTGPELAGRRVRYLEAIPGADRIAYDRLSDLIPEESFMPFATLWQEGFPGRPGQTWLTSRFHFHLLAAACGAEGSALEVNEDYYRTKHQSLVEAGTGWAVTEAGSTSVTPPAGAGAFRSTAVRLHRAKLGEAEELYPAAPAPELGDPPPPPPRASGWFRRR